MSKRKRTPKPKLKQVIESLFERDFFEPYKLANQPLENLTTEEIVSGGFIHDLDSIVNELQTPIYKGFEDIFQPITQGPKGILTTGLKGLSDQQRYGTLNNYREAFFRSYNAENEAYLMTGLLMSGLRENIITKHKSSDRTMLRREYKLQVQVFFDLGKVYEGTENIQTAFQTLAIESMFNYVQTLKSAKEIEHSYKSLKQLFEMIPDQENLQQQHTEQIKKMINSLRSKIGSYEPRGTQWGKFL